MIAAVMVALWSTPALADEDEAETCVRTKVRASYPEGWSVRTGARATLFPGQHHVYAVTFQEGNTYRVTGCGDPRVTDLDVVVYGPDKTVLIDDQSDDREPIVQLRAATTGTHYVVVYVGTAVEPDMAVGVASMVTYR